MTKVLVAPLDWGLGHATRCIPVIRELLQRNCQVFLASSGDALALLKKEFPTLAFFTLPAYCPVYPSSGSMVWKMAAQFPKFVSAIRREHCRLEQLISENKIELVISDNRYGCWSAATTSVFITHQINILLPKGYAWLARFIGKVNQKMIEKFTVCWIPDADDKHNLVGALASSNEKIQSEITHIGNLSQFKACQERAVKYDVVCIFSGPEPQRSILEEIVVKQVRQSALKYFVVRGLLTSSHSVLADSDSIDFLQGEELQAVIEQSDYVIARSGFSTVMDLARLGKKAIFIPTPGQTEQEYLADRLMKMKIAYAMEQHSFDLNTAWEQSADYTGFRRGPDHSKLLTDAVDEILIRCSSGSQDNHC